MNSKVVKTVKRAIGIQMCLVAVATLCVFTSEAFARDVTYSGTGDEVNVYVRAGEPTQVKFPGEVVGGFKPKMTSLALDHQDTYLVVFARPSLPPEGEAMIVHLKDKRTYNIRITPSTGDHSRDALVNVIDTREDLPGSPEEVASMSREEDGRKPQPSSSVAGLMREMIRVAEFGKTKGIVGYRRSSKYSGEEVLNDGALIGKIDEIFMGTDLTGYVMSIENMLDTTQNLNPATFRLDGTRAVSMQRWELAPRPVTSEQQISGAHRAKVYIVTRSISK